MLRATRLKMPLSMAISFAWNSVLAFGFTCTRRRYETRSGGGAKTSRTADFPLDRGNEHQRREAGRDGCFRAARLRREIPRRRLERYALRALRGGLGEVGEFQLQHERMDGWPGQVL